jgi:hypothetical protein
MKIFLIMCVDVLNDSEEVVIEILEVCTTTDLLPSELRSIEQRLTCGHRIAGQLQLRF